LSNTADITAHLEVNVSAVGSPVRAPRVSDVPDVHAGHLLPASELDAMVESSAAAAGGGDDSAGIVLPDGGVDADRGRSSGIGEGLHGSLVVILSDPLPARDFGNNISAIEAASSLDTIIRIIIVSFKASSTHDILIGSWRVSTVAAAVGAIAIDNLLHGEVVEAVSGKGPHALDVLGGGGGPAGTALALVVDGGDDSARVPVVRGGISQRVGRLHVFDCVLEAVAASEVLQEEALGELVLREVHELGHSPRGMRIGGVHLGGDGQVGLEDLKAIGKLTWSIALAVSPDEVLEFLLISDGSRGQCKALQNKEGENNEKNEFLHQNEIG